ncbi:hypothetical protein BGX27_003703 [Mortierella sp. AM989]|nr:hypothetical protein BGX27_003703 [Mortierella sp. AM989]
MNDRKQSIGASGARRKASQSNTTSSNNHNQGLASKAQTAEGYVPVNNFNSQDVVNHFDRSKLFEKDELSWNCITTLTFETRELLTYLAWKAARETHAAASNSAKSEMYEMYKGSEAMAWGDKVAAKGAMSTGIDFLAELKKKQSTAA